MHGANVHGANVPAADVHGPDVHGPDVHGADVHSADVCVHRGYWFQLGSGASHVLIRRYNDTA